jgi:hypothetical protein
METNISTIMYSDGQCLQLCSRLTLIDYLRFYVLLKNFSFIRRRHHCRWRAAKYRPMLGAQGLWAGRDLYRATPVVTRDLGFFRSHPKDRPTQSPLTTHLGVWRIYSNSDPYGATSFEITLILVNKCPSNRDPVSMHHAKYPPSFCTCRWIVLSALLCKCATINLLCMIYIIR